MRVPPVVITTSTPAASRRAASTGSPSGTTTGSSTVKPLARSHVTISGPVLSSYTPAAARLDAAITLAVLTTLPRPPRPTLSTWQRASRPSCSLDFYESPIRSMDFYESPIRSSGSLRKLRSSALRSGPDPGLAALLAFQPHLGQHGGRVHRLD